MSNLRDIYQTNRKFLTFKNSVKFEEDDKKYIIRKFKLDQVLPFKNYLITATKHPNFIVRNLQEYRNGAMYVLQENYEVNLYSYLKGKTFEQRLEFLPSFLNQMFKILIYLDTINICYNNFNPFTLKIKDDTIYLVNFDNITYKLKHNIKNSYIKQKDDFGHPDDNSYHNGYNDLFSVALLTLYILTNKMPYHPNNYYGRNDDVLNYVFKTRDEFEIEILEKMEPYLELVRNMINSKPYQPNLLKLYNTISKENLEFDLSKEEITIEASEFEELYNLNIKLISDLEESVLDVVSILNITNNYELNLSSLVHFVNMMITSNYDCSTNEFIKFWDLIKNNSLLIKNINY
jgi:hypothetical protein